MAVDHFGFSQAGPPRNIVKIGSKLAIVANWNLNQWRFERSFVFGGTNLEHVSILVLSQAVELGSGRRDPGRIKKNADGRVGGRQLDHAWNRRRLERAKGREHRIQRGLGITREIIDDANNQRRISQRIDLHGRLDTLGGTRFRTSPLSGALTSSALDVRKHVPPVAGRAISSTSRFPGGIFG